jgi:hypothetical protein
VGREGKKGDGERRKREKEERGKGERRVGIKGWKKRDGKGSRGREVEK